MRSICLDIGTTTIKGLIYDELGRVCRKAERLPKLKDSQQGYREHDPQEIIWHVVSLLKELVSYINMEREELLFISLSCYMHSLILLDENDEALTSCILWNDSRSSRQAELAKQNSKGFEIYARTGTPIHPMSPLYKLRYFRETDEELFSKVAKAVSAKELLVKKMCGEWLIDQSIASATGMFDIFKKEWDAQALEYAGISEDILSKPVPTRSLLPDLLPEFKQEIGLKNSPPVVIGASDGCLATLGSHGLEPGIAVCTIGTSGALRVVADRPLIDDGARTFSYILDDDIFVSGGAINNGCIAYEWLRRILSYEDQHLDSIFTGEDFTNYGKGLLFLPFLSGERAPYWDADLRASYLGLRHEHSKKDLLIAGIEGISFAIRDVLEVLESKDQKANIIYANGGFTNSMIWLQILSDICQKPVKISDQGDGALFGAFLLGLSAVNKIPGFKGAEDYFLSGQDFLPREKSDYEEKFSIYQKAVESNREILHLLAKEK